MQRTLGSLLFLALCIFAAPLFAQTIGTGIELSVTLAPEHPRPNETVTVSVESYNIDLNRTEVRWYVNDTLVKSGVGEKRLEMRLPPAGRPTTVRIVAVGENGAMYSSSLTLNPAEVNLLWQTQSYTPPFYKGKALMPFQGTVLVAAIPSFTRNGAVLPTDSLIYTWKEGDEVVGDSSGKGKNLFVFQGSVPMRTKSVSVLVESLDYTMAAETSIDITPVSPRTLFYEEHPRYGLNFAKALVNIFMLEEDEISIGAVPYYFEIPARDARTIVYDWQVNYKPLKSESKPFITLRRTAQTAGNSVLFLESRSTDEAKLFQTSEERLTIQFPKKSPLEDAARAQ